jgi:hypothetical protein
MERKERSRPELRAAVRLLATDVPTLVREGVRLAKLQTRYLGARAGVVTASAIASLIGFLLVCLGISFLLSEVLERAWAGPLIVGATLVVVSALTIVGVLRQRA